MKKNIVFVVSILLFSECSCSMDQSNNIVTTPSGLQYIALTTTSGIAPKAGQKVTVHYTGWLGENGKPGNKFDSSYDRKKPFSFIVGVGQVIQGWDEGVLGMKVGEKRRFIIPPNLGYGRSGIPGAIPPDATLIFDVELLSVG